MLTHIILANLICNPAVSADTHARIKKATQAGDQATLESVHRKLTQQVATAGAGHDARYVVAYLSWRLSHMTWRKPGLKATRDGLLKQAQMQLERRLRAYPDDGESQVLLAAVLGELIGNESDRGRTLGPRSGALMVKASSNAPNSPRVALLKGIWLLFMPAMYGGGLDRAEAELDRAIELFRAEARHPNWPDWGRTDAYAWRGQVALKKGDRAQAKAFYEAGLRQSPNAAWIRDKLLPAVD